MAAEHAGFISSQEIGLVTMYLESGLLSYNLNNTKGSTRNGVATKEIPYAHPRLIQLDQGRAVDLLVSSVAGRPAALLESPVAMLMDSPCSRPCSTCLRGWACS